jgi:hypothetical protein
MESEIGSRKVRVGIKLDLSGGQLLVTAHKSIEPHHPSSYQKKME